MSKEKFSHIFESVSKETWIEKIKKDLKGKDIDSLFWKYNNEILVDPFTHKDDIQDLPSPIIHKPGKNKWKIALNIACDDASRTNRALLNCLENGVEHVVILVANSWSPEDLLSDVYLSMISVDFTFTEMEGLANWLNELNQFLEVNNFEKELLDIGFVWKGKQAHHHLFSDLTQNWNHLSRNIHFISIEENAINELANLLHQSYALLNQNASNNNKIDVLLENFCFHISIGNEILFEIAKIRAFRILWSNLLDNIGLPYKDPLLYSYVDNACLTSDPNDNLVLLSVQAVIASIGGIDVINVSNINDNKDDQFYGRIAMNIQHIMRFESKLDLVQDPSAGSYHFELLSEKIVKLAWSKFLEK